MLMAVLNTQTEVIHSSSNNFRAKAATDGLSGIVN